MFVRTSMDSESQDATKITSALADSCICSSVKMVTLDIHMNAIIIFSVSHLLFSSSVVAMTRSRLTGVCMTSNDVPGISSWRLRLPILRRLIEGKKGTTILTLKVKVKTVTGLAQRTNGVLRCIHIISLFYWAGIAGIYGGIGPSKYISNLSVCCIHCSCGTWDRHETCVARSYTMILVGWMVICATMLVMRSSPHLRLLRECSPSPGPCV